MEEFAPRIEADISFHKRGVCTVCFSPDQSKICSADTEGKVILTDLEHEDYNIYKVLIPESRSIVGSSFSPNGKLLAVSSVENTVHIFEVESESEDSVVLDGHTRVVRTVKFLHLDPTKVVSGSEDETIKIWDIEQKKQVSNYVCGGNVWTVDILPGDNTFVSGDGNAKLKVWDRRSARCIKTLEHHSSTVRSVHYHSKTFSLASGSWDQTIKIVDFRSFKILQNLPQHTHYVRSVCFHPSGLYLLSGSHDRTVKIFDTGAEEEGGKVVLFDLNEHKGDVRSVQFSPDGKFFVSGSIDKKVILWSFPLGKLIKTTTDRSDEDERVGYLVEKLLCGGEGEEEVYVENSVLKITIDFSCTLYCLKFLLL